MELNTLVDYYGEGCPFWTFTNTGNGNYLIQTLTTHETYGQEAMPDTYLGNNPTKEANNEGGTPLGVYNDVDGNVTNTEGMNITWTLELVSARSDAQVTLLQELITIAQGLDMDTSEEETVLNNEEATYLEMTGTIVNLQKHIKEREEYLNKANKKKEDLNRLIACANAVDVDTNDAQAVADNSSNLDEINEAINTLRDTYITKLGDGVATTLLPLDVTGAILNPSFVIDDADGWNWNDEEDGPQFQSFNNAEFFETTFDFNQELTGLPNGRYLLKVKGFHRPGSNEDVFNDYLQGTDNACAQLYANDESVTLVNQASGAQDEQIDGWCGTEVSSDGTTRYVPNTMYDAYMWFNQGYYENELPVTVTDGTLTLGIRLDESVEAGWVIFDDFRLEYQGAASPAITFADDAVKALCVANWDTNHDGELSMAEAAAVTNVGEVFTGNTEIISFDELQYFTGLTRFVNNAFKNCSNLASITIPTSITSFGSAVFRGCLNLTSIDIPSSVKTIATYAFYECTGLTSINIPNDVSVISGSSFYGCSSLSSVIIPDNANSIGTYAFYGCSSLTSIDIPSSVTSIGDWALAKCSNLSDVIVRWEEPLTVSDKVFQNVNIDQATLYVPYGTKAAYQAADVWKDFGHIVEYTDLVENGKMEEEPSGDWTSFWVHEWRTMEEQFDGPANIVEDPTDASNHCVKVVVRSEAEAREAGNMIEDGEGNCASWDSQFFIQSKDKIESGKRLKLTMRVRVDKPTYIISEAQDMPGDYNTWEMFDDINVTSAWQKIEREVIVTPDMTQEFNGKELHTVAFHLSINHDGNVFYFDDIKLEVMGDSNSKKLLCELIANMEAIGGYELDDAKSTADNNDATKEELEDAITQLQQQIKDRCANAEVSDLPVDATGLITNPSFTCNNAAYWQGDTPWFQSYNNAEFFETTFNFNQELTDLPNGRYLLKVKGFHRPGHCEDVFNDYQQGTNNARAQLYANDESVVLNNHASGALEEKIDGWIGVEVSADGTTRYVPDNMHDAYVWFNNGYYENELPVTVTDGTLTIGIRLDESVDGGWVIFDDFRLEYLEPVQQDDTDRLYADVEKVLLFPGSTAELSLSLDNGEEYTYNGYQFDIQLPEGVTLAKSGNKYQYTLGDRYSGEGMMININARGNGKYSVVCMSMDNICITGTTGTLLTLNLQASDDITYGEYAATITNINLSTEGLVNLALNDVEVPVCVSEFEMGDVNHDTAISVTDVMAIVDYILGRASSDFDEDLADINYDGIITVTDVMGLVNVILFSNTHHVPANAITTFENMTMMPTADGFELSTENAYTACQMTVVLPEGGKLTGAYGPSGSKAMVNDLGGGRFNVVVYSPEGQPLSIDGSLVRLQIRGNSRGISISDMQLTNRRLETIIPDEATGITEMAGDSSAGDSYNLQGIKVKTPQRGVYIRNGKKETVKFH